MFDCTVCTVNMGSLLEAVLLERCDGNRNILHACVSRSFPTSAHEPGEAVESQGSSVSTATGALGNKLESIKGAVDALAAAVAAAAAAVRSSGELRTLIFHLASFKYRLHWAKQLSSLKRPLNISIDWLIINQEGAKMVKDGVD